MAAQRDELLRGFLERHAPGCPACGYSLRGCVTEICPECGIGLRLALAPRRADRRTLVLLGVLMGWVLLASALDTYKAQRSAFGRTQALVVTTGNAFAPVSSASNPAWVTLPRSTTWTEWVRVCVPSAMALLALGGLAGLVVFRRRAEWPAALVRYSVIVFLACAAFRLVFGIT